MDTIETTISEAYGVSGGPLPSKEEMLALKDALIWVAAKSPEKVNVVTMMHLCWAFAARKQGGLLGLADKLAITGITSAL